MLKAPLDSQSLNPDNTLFLTLTRTLTHTTHYLALILSCCGYFRYRNLLSLAISVVVACLMLACLLRVRLLALLSACLLAFSCSILFFVAQRSAQTLRLITLLAIRLIRLRTSPNQRYPPPGNGPNNPQCFYNLAPEFPRKAMIPLTYEGLDSILN
jgi:hypothetical protein